MSQQQSEEVVTSQPRRRKFEEGDLEWKTGLFDCFLEPKQACVTCLCLPCVACKLARDIDEMLGFITVLFVPGGLTALRTKMRVMYGLQGCILCDCLITEFCCPCAICQMDREMNTD